MKHEDFSVLLEQRLGKTRDTMSTKGDGYRSEDDQFHNFKAAGRKRNETPEKALMGMKVKHDVSVDDIVDNLEKGIIPTRKLIDEKIGDEIVYLTLLEGLLVERIRNG